MRPLQPIILMSMSHKIGDWLLLIEALLVNSSLGEVRLDDVKLAQMPSALTLLTDTHVGIMMTEVSLC